MWEHCIQSLVSKYGGIGIRNLVCDKFVLEIYSCSSENKSESQPINSTKDGTPVI